MPKLRLAVCIIGQLGRLELASKISNLLVPNKGMHLRVFFVLESSSSTIFSRLEANETKCASNETEQSSRALLDLHGVASTWVPVRRWTDRSIIAYRFKQQGLRIGKSYHFENTLSAFSHFRSCAVAVEQYELNRNERFSAILRIRDNTIVAIPLRLRNSMLSGGCKVKRCNEWGGVNDKVMLIPRKHLQHALRSPFEEFLFENFSMITNSETWLARILFRHRVPISLQTSNHLPLVDARPPCMCNETRRWCLVPPTKDCYPTSLWEPGQVSELYTVSPLGGERFCARLKRSRNHTDADSTWNPTTHSRRTVRGGKVGDALWEAHRRELHETEMAEHEAMCRNRTNTSHPFSDEPQ